MLYQKECEMKSKHKKRAELKNRIRQRKAEAASNKSTNNELDEKDLEHVAAGLGMGNNSMFGSEGDISQT